MEEVQYQFPFDLNIFQGFHFFEITRRLSEHNCYPYFAFYLPLDIGRCLALVLVWSISDHIVLEGRGHS